MVEVYLPAINLLAVGETPRMYELLRQTIVMSLPYDPVRVESLIDYVNRSERGEATLLRNQVDIHNSVANPEFINEPVPAPRALLLQPRAQVVVGSIEVGDRQHDEKADTLAAPVSSPEEKNGE